MSFGFSVADGFTLIQLAWSTYDGAKRACNEHGDLTREMYSLYTVLDHLQSEVANPDSLIHQAKGNRRKELENHMEGCGRHLRRINAILNKFNALTEDERSGTQLWQKVRFGNGAVKDVAEIRQKITMYTTAISMSLHLLSQGSQGKIERMIDRQGGEMRGIRESINLLLAKPSTTHEGSVFTDYSHDDIAWWRTFRHNLIKSGYKSKAIASHMGLIQAYVKELGDKGVFDDGINCSRLSLDSYSDVDEVAEVVELPATTTPSINRTYAGEDTFENHNAGPIMSEMAQRIGHLEEQLLQAINRENERARGSDEFSSTQPPDTRNHDAEVDGRPVSPITDTEAEDIAPQFPETPPLSVAEFLSMVEKDFVQEGEDPLDKEDLIKALTEAFSALPPEERKKVITLQDPSEKKYSFPYYLVTTWDGMKHLMEQAFLNTEGIGEHVTKGEYDLINSDGAVIIPQLWETFVEADMTITMDIRPIPELTTPIIPFAEVISRAYSPPPPPVRRAETSASSQRSSPRSSSKSISNSSIKSGSKSNTKPRSFWGFIQRPKPKKRPRSLPKRPPPPPPRWYLPPPYSPPPPPPPRPSLYTYSIPLPTKRYKETTPSDPKPISPGVIGIVYPTTNEVGAPIFELE